MMKQNEELIRNFIKALCALCPSLRPQFERLGHNRLKALEMTKDNKCWNCGQEGHIRAQCPVPQQRTKRYATDARR